MAPGAACLLCRKQGRSCSRLAQVSGSVVPALRRGLEHLGERAWRRHLAEECVSSIAFCLGWAAPSLPPAGFVPRGVWCLAAPSLLPVLGLAGWCEAGGPAVTPQETPSQVSGSAARSSLRHRAAVQVSVYGTGACQVRPQEPQEVTGSAVSSLLSRGCTLSEGQEQAKHHSPRREKAASWYGAGDTKQTLDSMHPFGAAPNPVLSLCRGQWLCLLTPFLWSWCLCSDPRGI